MSRRIDDTMRSNAAIWLRIPGVDRQPGRLCPRRRIHTAKPKRESPEARYHAAWKARTGSPGNELLRDLPLELNAVGTLSGYGFHPLKAQLTCQITNLKLSGPRGALQRAGHAVPVLRCPVRSNSGRRIKSRQLFEPRQ